MLRRDFLTAPALAWAAQAQLPDSAAWAQSGIIPAPDDAAAWPAFRDALVSWRAGQRARVGYSDALYRRPEFAWVGSSFSCCFLMMNDELFYDRERAEYLVDDWVDAGIREFGGYDSVVLWHAYPRIGLDERNQFDFYRDMPGGVPGVRAVTSKFHARGVRVYIDYNPWDTGTRRESMTDVDAVIEMVKAIGADGVFLDTMNKGAAEFRARLDAARPGVVLESEISLPVENIHDHHMSWAQGFEDSRVPGVLRNKWIERRHMQHQIKRWNPDHTSELQTAWMNGSGIMVWENVFGSWVGMNARDRCLLRAMLPVQRRYAQVFSGERWTPLVPTATPPVYASLWEAEGLRLWTAVNRSEEARDGVVLSVPHQPGNRYFDLIAGQEIPVAPGGVVNLSATIGPRGLAGFVAAPRDVLGADFERFLAAQSAVNRRADWSTAFPARVARLQPSPVARAAKAPDGMVGIPRASIRNMATEYRVRETGFYTGTEYVPDRGYTTMFQLERTIRNVELQGYAIDLTPVTNAQYAGFLRQSGYKPRHPENFLKHWVNGAPPAGKEDHPVVYVDLTDARAYAAWAGKRLPLEEEWQYAAEGRQRVRYPWGNSIRPNVCNAGESGRTTPVKAFPEGRSPFGCYDMCGNTWEWTESERSDGRTRFAMIRGGSYFEAKGSNWYMDGGPQPCNFAAKILLLWPGLDRCATVGFRCAVSLD
jgi:formylglycine-generating enzyme required for sulfatase activity